MNIQSMAINRVQTHNTGDMMALDAKVAGVA